MRYLKYFESNRPRYLFRGKYNDNGLPKYPCNEMEDFVQWANIYFKEVQEKEGWIIVYNDRENGFERYDTNNSFYDIEKNDEDDLLKNDSEARVLAQKYGIMVDDIGFIIGYDGKSFLDNQNNEFLSSFKGKLKKVKTQQQFDL